MNTHWPIRIVVATWLIQLSITYQAWFGGGLFDVFIFDGYHPIVQPILGGLFVLFLLCILFFESYRKGLFFGLLCILLVLILCNPHLLQPWQFVHGLVLGALIFNNRLFLTITLGGLYFWSGANKLNPWFYDEVFCWFFSPIIHHPPPVWAMVVPFLEILSGILLLFGNTQRSAALFCMVKHVFIAVLLSPFLLNWNAVVIPWNLCLAALLFVIYIQPSKPKRTNFRPTLITYAAIAVVWVAPAFWYVNKWPTPLSFHLYSGYHSEAYVVINDQPHDLNAMTQNLYGLPLNLTERFVEQLYEKIKIYQPDVQVIYVYKDFRFKRKIIFNFIGINALRTPNHE
jgi:uncharacterized membrane protein YphA (DoxX/SURF4 family)